jgi:hypothetical protein
MEQANPQSESAAERALRRGADRCWNWIGHPTLLSCAFAIGFLWLFNGLVAQRTAEYYGAMSAPPSFRHMDPMDLKRVLIDYLDAHRPGPDTVLVLGDCVAFGHGVVTPFPGMLEVPGYRVLNISMQSFRFDLMLIVLDEAMQRGVKHVVIQLHPFGEYRNDAAQWRRLKAQRAGTTEAGIGGVRSSTPAELIADADANWKVIALTLKSDERFFDAGERLPTGTLTSALRYDVLSAWPLYRSRFAFDDWSGFGFSYFTERTHRTDSYLETLPEAQHRQIFAEQADFFRRFVISDRSAYAGEMTEYSATARIASVLRAANADAVFVMAPTFVEKIAANTELPAADLQFVSDTMRQVVEAHGFRYLDYLADADFEAEMVHFDNVTAKGQQMLGERLNRDLPKLSFPGSREVRR